MILDKVNIRQIAIFRALQLGDILCTIPALRNLRENFPSARIFFIGLPSSKGLIERFSNYFDEFIAFPGYPGLPEQDFDSVAFEEFAVMMQNRKFDLLLQLQGNGSIVNEMLSRLQAKFLAGFSIDEDELISNPLMMRYPNFGHESARHLKLISFLGLQVSKAEMEYPIFKSDQENFIDQHFPLAERYICLHAGSRASWRQWPTTFFARIADLCYLNGYQIVLTGTQEESNLAQEVSEKMEFPALVLAGKTNLGTLGILLKKSAGLIANCTGISHIAAGLGVPSVIISMDGEPERWAPPNQEIHYTLDWTETPDYNLVEQAVKKYLIHQPVRSTLS